MKSITYMPKVDSKGYAPGPGVVLSFVAILSDVPNLVIGAVRMVEMDILPMAVTPSASREGIIRQIVEQHVNHGITTRQRHI